MLRPIDAGMLNGRILLAPSVQDAPSRIHPVIIKMVRGPVPMDFASYFVLFRSAYLLHRYSSVRFTFARGYLSPHNTAAKSEHFLYISSAPRI